MEPSPYLTKASIIDAAWEARADEHEAQLRQVRLGLQWALRHPVEVDADGVVGEHAGWGEPGWLASSTAVVPLAGPGAPLVAAYAPVELAAALSRPAAHGRQLIADALELVFRLPRLWTLTQEQRVPVWLAREISRQTHDLSLDAALHADRLITAVPEKITAVAVGRLVHEARLHADPDRAVAEEEEALSRRGVWLHRDGSAPATTEVTMTLETPDAELLDQSVSRIAADLRDLGDTSSRDERRARAVGVLADPQHALDLMSGRADAAPSSKASGSLDLVVHLAPADLDTKTGGRQAGVALCERRGAVSTDLLARWTRAHAATGGRVSVRVVAPSTPAPDQVAGVHETVAAWLADRAATRPIVRRTVALDDPRAVDQHDPPPLMAEQVVMRDAHCVFPGCRRDSRACDLDHVAAYVPLADGGPPGQTTAANLSPLCRRHHNAKTHGGWSYRRTSAGSYAWTSPTGHAYVVVGHSRRPLGGLRGDRRA